MKQTSIGPTIWLTGLSGAGKSTLANGLANELRQRSVKVEVLDGEAMREHLSLELGFTKQDRSTNVRRIAYVAKLLTRNNVTTIVAAISPYRETRDEARASLQQFVEVYVKCPLEVLVARDPKGLYRRALKGEIPNFTGVSDPYEEPLAPEIVVETDRQTVGESLAIILDRLWALGYLEPVAELGD